MENEKDERGVNHPPSLMLPRVETVQTVDDEEDNEETTEDVSSATIVVAVTVLSAVELVVPGATASVLFVELRTTSCRLGCSVATAKRRSGNKK